MENCEGETGSSEVLDLTSLYKNSTHSNSRGFRRCAGPTKLMRPHVQRTNASFVLTYGLGDVVLWQSQFIRNEKVVFARGPRRPFPQKFGMKSGIYAARSSVTMGRCLRPATKLALIANGSPGWPATSVCGWAQREFRGQRDRGSHRGRLLAGHRP